MADEPWAQPQHTPGAAVDSAASPGTELDPVESATNEPDDEPLPDRRYEPL